jgi:hypothetical protein
MLLRAVIYHVVAESSYRLELVYNVTDIFLATPRVEFPTVKALVAYVRRHTLNTEGEILKIYPLRDGYHFDASMMFSSPMEWHDLSPF